jgi:hypothetical protein
MRFWPNVTRKHRKEVVRKYRYSYCSLMVDSNKKYGESRRQRMLGISVGPCKRGLFLVTNLYLFSLVTAKLISDSKGKMQRTGSSLVMLIMPIYWRSNHSRHSGFLERSGFPSRSAFWSFQLSGLFQLSCRSGYSTIVPVTKISGN